MIITLLALALGFVACFFGGMVGIGGGWATLPVLRIFGGYSPAVVSATSLMMVAVNAGMAAYALRNKKRINTRLGWAMGGGGAAGSVLGALLSSRVPSGWFDVMYGLLLLFLAWSLLRPKKNGDESEDIETHESLRASRLELAAVGLGTGIVSSLFGVGGGILIVPLLLWRYKIPTHIAMATSSFVIAIYILPGVIAQMAGGSVNWALAIPLMIGGGGGAFFGARASTKIKADVLKRTFAVICIVAFLGLTLRHIPKIM